MGELSSRIYVLFVLPAWYCYKRTLRMLGSRLAWYPGLFYWFVELFLCHQSPDVVPNLQLVVGYGCISGVFR